MAELTATVSGQDRPEDWPVEEINERSDDLYLFVHENDWAPRNKKKAFVIRGKDGMSVDWSRYRTNIRDVVANRKNPDVFGVVSLNVGDLLDLLYDYDQSEMVRLRHEPIRKDTLNRAHSLVQPTRPLKMGDAITFDVEVLQQMKGLYRTEFPPVKYKDDPERTGTQA